MQVFILLVLDFSLMQTLMLGNVQLVNWEEGSEIFVSHHTMLVIIILTFSSLMFR